MPSLGTGTAYTYKRTNKKRSIFLILVRGFYNSGIINFTGCINLFYTVIHFYFFKWLVAIFKIILSGGSRVGTKDHGNGFKMHTVTTSFHFIINRRQIFISLPAYYVFTCGRFYRKEIDFRQPGRIGGSRRHQHLCSKGRNTEQQKYYCQYDYRCDHCFHLVRCKINSKKATCILLSHVTESGINGFQYKEIIARGC
jgi:hypothetical protein